MSKELKISAIKEGTAIDHVPSDAAFKVAEILNLSDEDNVISVATNLKSKRSGKKGIIKVGKKILTKEEVDKISIIAPNATVNLIENYDVKKKIQVSIPETFVKIIKCSNPNCITGDKSVAHESAGTTILLFFKLSVILREYNIKRLAEDPELTKTEYLVPNHSDHFLSNPKVIEPLVNLGYVFNHLTKLSISSLLIVSFIKLIIS